MKCLINITQLIERAKKIVLESLSITLAIDEITFCLVPRLKGLSR